MYKYRIYPSRKQKVRIINSLKTCKVIYNELLAMSIDSYRFGKVSFSGFDYNKYLTSKYLEVYSQSKQNVSDRVYKAFKNFFCRVKNESCKKKGFPRFKSRVNSITFPQYGFKLLSDKRLKLSKIGNIPIILHRIPKGKIKTLTIKQNKAGQWFAIFSCEMPESKVIHPSNQKIGIDVGIENFATLSNGEVVANPHFLIKAEKMLKRLQRRLSRKVKGSNNRRKARFRLAKQHLKITNIRTDWLHKLTKSLTLKYGTIAIEELKINNMVHNHYLAKSITDASWGIFFNMLSYKEVILGGECIKRNPRRTSMTCSNCGELVDMPLAKRTFKCPKCLNVLHRDHNSAINILNGMGGLPKTLTPVDIEPLPSSNGKACSIVEAGTITTKPSTSSVVGISTL